MNADAYLRRQGWKGSGHSLDSTGRGIKKPLLIAHKQDQLGLGKRKAAHTTDDQWWMRAFDQSLQSIGTGKESTLSQIRTQGINRGGLYGFFVKGEAIAGTIDDSSTAGSPLPLSGTSTPPTSAPETDIEAMSTMVVQAGKRKRSEPEASSASKKAKTITTNVEHESAQEAAIEQTVVAAKLAKLTTEEKAEYESRAALKKQTLAQYVLRRIQKKAVKKAEKCATAPAPVEPTNPPLFFADLEGDANLANPVVYTPLPNGKCPLDPTIWADREFHTLPKKVKRAKREYIRQQRLEKSFATSLTADQQDKFIQRAYTKLRVDPDDATEEQRMAARDEAKKLMRQGRAAENEKNSVSKGKKKTEPKEVVYIDYTPLPDGSCPLDPILWKDHKPKVLPKAVKEARHRWIVEQRLAKKLKAADEMPRKLPTGLTKAEKKLLRKKSAEKGSIDENKIDEDKIDKRLWGEDELMEKHLRKVERKKQQKEQVKIEYMLKQGTKEIKSKTSKTRSGKNYQLKNPDRILASTVAVAAN